MVVMLGCPFPVPVKRYNAARRDGRLREAAHFE